jgi:CMP-N-acetylneuraminic acid synthetase
MLSNKSMVLAVILARGGSKGIPRKNLKKIGGVSLIGRTIKAAQGAKCVSTVLVSTDDNEILEEAVSHGAETIRRPAELAGDTASSESALLHAVRAWHEAGNQPYQAIALLQVTSPFTQSADIDHALEPILTGDADSTLTVVDDYGYFWSKNEEGWRMQYQVRARRQDRMPWKRESGNVYGVRYQLFLRTGKLFVGRVQAVTIPSESCLEIDEPRDLLLAEALDSYSRGGGTGK